VTAIAGVETFRCDYPVAGQFKFFVTRAGQAPARATLLVKLTASDGNCGWGQCVPSPRWSYETIETVESTIGEHLGPLLVGRDPFDLAGISLEMNRAIAPSFSIGQPIAKAGIDLALHDLTGRIANQSLAARWGRSTSRPVALSWTLNPQTLDEVPAQVAEALRRGYGSFNLKVAPDLNFDRQLCRLVRQLAPQAGVWADANGGYDEATAQAAARDFADLGLLALEQPLPANRLGGYRRLQAQRALPIVMDEGIVARVDLEEFLQLGLLDGVALKVARCGGLTEATAIVQLAREAGLLVLGSGLTDPDLSLAASLALFSAYDISGVALNGPQYLTTSILREPFLVRNGALYAPEGCGLGVEVDERLVLGKPSR
jgi:muconate cycloisomerase